MENRLGSIVSPQIHDFAEPQKMIFWEMSHCCCTYLMRSHWSRVRPQPIVTIVLVRRGAETAMCKAKIV
jgi:hypothetical protein